MVKKKDMTATLRRIGVPVSETYYGKLLDELGVESEDDKAVLRSIVIDRIFQRKRNKKGIGSEEALLTWLRKMP